jgi:hypothetical protein
MDRRSFVAALSALVGWKAKPGPVKAAIVAVKPSQTITLNMVGAKYFDVDSFADELARRIRARAEGSD